MIMPNITQEQGAEPKEFSNLQIREFPAELQSRAKAEAALRRMDLKDFVILAIEAAVAGQSVPARN